VFAYMRLQITNTHVQLLRDSLTLTAGTFDDDDDIQEAQHNNSESVETMAH
jgi:hypothetical protein